MNVNDDFIFYSPKSILNRLLNNFFKITKYMAPIKLIH